MAEPFEIQLAELQKETLRLRQLAEDNEKKIIFLVSILTPVPRPPLTNFDKVQLILKRSWVLVSEGIVIAAILYALSLLR